jgi:hypothetical protein
MVVHAAYEAPSPSDGTGGDGGCSFDTGRNIAGVRKVKVWTFCEYIRAIALEFNDGTDTLQTVQAANDCGGPREVVVPPGEKIIKVLVWANKARVEAIQFLMNGGTVSPRFGQGSANTPVEYSGKTGEECLVGMYGASGTEITRGGRYKFFYRIGCSFHNTIGFSQAVAVSEASTDQVSVAGELINTSG